MLVSHIHFLLSPEQNLNLQSKRPQVKTYPLWLKRPQ